MRVGSAGSDELTVNTSKISSLMYIRYLKMLKPEKYAIGPNTITTKRMQVA